MSAEVKLYNKDCIEAMKEIDDNSVDLILTDPPYNLGNFMRDRQTNLGKMRDNFFGIAGWDDLEFDQWKAHMEILFEESSRILKEKGAMIIFMSILRVETLVSIAQEKDFYYKTTGIWHKTNPMPRNMNLHFINSTEAWIYLINDGRTGTFNNDGVAIHDFIETSVTPGSEKKHGKHPTQKPVWLFEHFIKLLTNSGGKVFDPFMGSGTAGVASKQLGRAFIGCELDEKYYKISESRINEVPETLKLF